ncbi:MAG: carbonic anhydrase [Nostocaceae cyanobacterium]|nr:carbonic anhydrase [Nostocaceae cyanobacterium]
MHRRKLLKYFSIGTVGFTVTACSNLQSSVLNSNKKDKVNWGYIGKDGAENWGKLSPEFAVCQSGKAQSPINIKSGISAKLPDLEIKYQSSPLRIINNGHTIQVNYQPGSMLILDNQTYELLQFHFHLPSEHKINGKPFPMELHLVHKSENGSLAVLGVFLKQGQENKALQAIWQAMPTSKSSEKTIANVTINASQLLPRTQNLYRYYGSLTTPPCSEIVNWIVYQEPVEISAAQIKQFSKIFAMNARPIQKRNRRFLLQSN